MRSGVLASAAPGRVLLALLALALLAGGCHAGPVDPDPVSAPTVAPVGGPVAFHVRLGAGQAITTRSPQPDNCPGVTADVTVGAHATLTVLAFAVTCAPGGDNARPGNGRHGVYRTSADIPAQRRPDARTVHTALGDALAFTQPYYECTNSCRNYTEPVAVITLAQPGDPALRALTVYSDKGSVGLDALVAFVRDQLLA